ncbi:hypothetical protein KP509_1Z238300 [Ceratopteris richardii]|nr:hypothetical protein KP509_1Z238300 [Ceratopteris richardii]
MHNHLHRTQVLYVLILLYVMCVNPAVIVRAARPHEADAISQSGAPSLDVAEGLREKIHQRAGISEIQHMNDDTISILGQELKLQWNCDMRPGRKKNCWCIPFLPSHRKNCVCGKFDFV